MARLTIATVDSGMSGMTCERIGGFNEGELNELKSMEHKEAVEKLIDMLNYRNNGQGSEWSYEYGICGVWFDNEYAYLNHRSCCN